MAPAALHPPDDWLSAYGLGTLDDPAAADVSRHLEACPACRRRVAELPADNFVGRLRDAFGPQSEHPNRGESVGGGPGGRHRRVPEIGTIAAGVVLVVLVTTWAVQLHDPSIGVEVRSDSNRDPSSVMESRLAAVPIDSRVRAAFTSRGTWTIVDDELVQESDRLGDCQIVFGDAAWVDFDFACEGKPLGGRGEIGQTFRVNDAGRYEWVLGRWTGDCDSLASVTAGQFERLRWRASNRLESGRWYKLEVRVRGPSIECMTDGQSVFRCANNHHGMGRVGLRTYRTAAQFRNLRVTDPAGEVLFEGLPKLPATTVDWIPDS